MSTKAALQYALQFQWLTTEPNPLVVDHSPDSGQRGWRRHAVKASATETPMDVKTRRAACGLRAAHGWNIDLFIEQKCARCLYALGLACLECHGSGTIPLNNKGSRGYCPVCFGGGMSPEAQLQAKQLKEVAWAKLAPATCNTCGIERVEDEADWTFVVNGMAIDNIGLTATPRRLDDVPLGDVFKGAVDQRDPPQEFGPTVKWFCPGCAGETMKAMP